MSARLTVRGILVDKAGKLFCVKLKGYGGKEARDFWCLPGGGIDPGEALVPALHREMVEETTVAPDVGELLYIQQFHDIDNGSEHFEFFFHIKNSGDYKDFDITKATHAAEEIADFGFVDPKTTYILPEFLTKEDIAAHIAAKAPTKIFSYLR
jgi:8-oxo-dGTP diphosphatase